MFGCWLTSALHAPCACACFLSHSFSSLGLIARVRSTRRSSLPSWTKCPYGLSHGSCCPRAASAIRTVNGGIRFKRSYHKCTVSHAGTKKPLAGDWQIFGKKREGRRTAGSEDSGIRERPAAGVSGEAKNPSPVSGASSSSLRGLFHPNGDTVTQDCWAGVAGILNLDEIRVVRGSGHCANMYTI